MNAYELVTTSAPQEQFLERVGAISPSNDSGSRLICAGASRPEVERFAGATDPNMAWCWINRLEKFFDEMVYPNDKRIVWAAALLDGDAHYWWMSITRRYEEPSSITWTKFLTHFFNKYINSGTRLATASSTKFQPLVKAVVSCEDEPRSHPRLQDVNGPSHGPFKRATSNSVVKSGTSPINNNVTRSHGGSWKRQRTQQTNTKVAVALVKVEPKKQVANLKCFNCGELGHISKVCLKPKKLTCFNCRQSGHIAKECTHQQTPTKVAVAPVRVEPIKQIAHLKCYNCRELGHISNVCTKPKNSACFKCGQSGHVVRECTQS